MRISFGGGGTELSPYVDQYGGAVISAAIGIYAHAYLKIDPKESRVTVASQESGVVSSIQIDDKWNLASIDPSLRLSAACLQYFSENLKLEIPSGLSLTTGSEAPIGSGLGASSVLTVSIVNALQHFFKLHWKKNDIAEQAHYIERNILQLSGGLQDHYPAIYGGLNYIDFDTSRRASIQPINLTPQEVSFLESSLLLVYSGQSRESSKIIDLQTKEVGKHNSSTIEAFHEIKLIADEMRKALAKMDLENFGKLLARSWEIKKTTSDLITNSNIDSIYNKVLLQGAYGGKISGAGGGGFFIFIVPPERKILIAKSILSKENTIFPSNIATFGAQIWQGSEFETL